MVLLMAIICTMTDIEFGQGIKPLFICAHRCPLSIEETNNLHHETLMKTFVLTDESLNSYGFWLPLSGAVLDQFKKNPVMLWMHNRAWRGTKDEVLPIGRWDNIRIKGKELLADSIFDDNDDFAVSIGDKVENNFLRMASCGIRIIETSSDPKWLKPGQTCETPIKWALKEGSICDIGSNDNSLALVFYDENDEIIKLADDGSGLPLKKLTDSQSDTPKKRNMKKIALFFKLLEEATEDQVLAAVQGLQDKLTLAEGAKTTAETKLADYEKKEKDLKKTEVTTLLDAAVKSGQINADARKHWENLFDKDHDSAKVTLTAIPMRRKVKDLLIDEKDVSEKEREVLAKLSFDEIDKQGKLKTLKENFNDLYIEKFEEKFHKKPN